VRILSSDEFEGREPGSKGETLTLRYLSGQFAALGLTPAGDHGGWTQAVPLRRFTLSHSSIQLRTSEGTSALQQGVEWAGTSQANVSQIEIQNAPVVFVGYGVSAPERDWDDYKGIDLLGKVAVFLINDPDFEAPEPGKFGGKAMTYYGRWTYKFEEAARRGALAALIVHEDAPATYGWTTVSNSWAVPQFDIERTDPRAAHPLFEGWITREVAERLFEQAHLTFEHIKQGAMREDFEPVVLKGTRISISAHVTVRRVISHNVIGQLPGRIRPQESIAFSAHWDHLGIGAPDASGDRIYHGAVDNALGVAGLLELARVFAHEPPTARSVLFIAFTGEEKNLLGSKYYVRHPVRALERTAAVFNMDTFNPHGPACDAQPSGAPQNTLESDLAKQALAETRTLEPDNHLEAGKYFRSDHFPFAQQGVPATTVSSGHTLYEGGKERGEQLYQEYITRHYHQPSDEWSPDWDLSGVALDLLLLHDTGRQIADSTVWPQWLDTSEFKAKRDVSSALRK
jgi:Zn-dependent M28 family amino/carboxypeptidase